MIFIVLISTCNKRFTAALYKIIETIEDMPGSRSSPPLDTIEKPQTPVGNKINTLDNPHPRQNFPDLRMVRCQARKVSEEGGGGRGRILRMENLILEECSTSMVRSYRKLNKIDSKIEL